MVTNKATIEREATEAAHQGRSINDACPYPFDSDAGKHWLAIYALAKPAPAPADTGCIKGADCTVLTGYCTACCS